MGNTGGRHHVPAAVGILEGQTGGAAGGDPAPLEGQRDQLGGGNHQQTLVGRLGHLQELQAQDWLAVLQDLELLDHDWLTDSLHSLQLHLSVDNLEDLALQISSLTSLPLSHSNSPCQCR